MEDTKQLVSTRPVNDEDEMEQEEQGSVYVSPAHWMAPLAGTQFLPRHTLLLRYLTSNTKACVLLGIPVVFIGSENCWFNTASSSTINYINNVLGMGAATMYYSQAFEPYRLTILRTCSDTIVNEVPTRVNIAVRGLCVKIGRLGTIRFELCPPLIEPRDPTSEASRIMASVCYQPVLMKEYLKVFKLSGQERALHYIRPLFASMNDMLLIMWLVGNTLIDPRPMSKSCLPLGRDGSGKSTLLRLIQEALAGCSETVPYGLVTQKSAAVRDEVAYIASNCRALFSQDIDFRKGNLNLALFKSLTGDDYVRTRGSNVRINTSFFGASNYVPDLEATPDLLSDAIMRGLVCIPMSESAIDLPQAVPISGPKDKLDFLCSCIMTRVEQDAPMLSPQSLVLTLTMSRFHLADSMLEYDDGYIPELMSGKCVLGVLSGVMGCSVEEVVRFSGLISSRLLIIVCVHKLLRNLRPKYPY